MMVEREKQCKADGQNHAGREKKNMVVAINRCEADVQNHAGRGKKNMVCGEIDER